MEITTRTSTQVPGVPRKPLDNPDKSKPAYASDEELADLLAAVLPRVPRRLKQVSGAAHPQLDALAACQQEAARQLIFIAAATHRAADERRTAEYLLRNRAGVRDGERTTLDLLLSARCAAEMDVRRVRWRETPVPREDLLDVVDEIPSAAVDEPSVSDLVASKLTAVTGRAFVSIVAVARFHDAVVIALELAERHACKRGKNPALLAMRCNVRKDARLGARLCDEFGNDRGARALARLLIGADGAPIEYGLLWWSTRRELTAADVPVAIRHRWIRCVRTADRAFGRSLRAGDGVFPRSKIALDSDRTNPLEYRIPDVAVSVSTESPTCGPS